MQLSRRSLADLNGKAFSSRSSIRIGNAASQKAGPPPPTAKGALSQLQGGKVFRALDLAQVCQQLPVAPEMAAVLTVNIL